MRLIDADALLVNLDNGIQGTARKYLKFYQMAINDEPTAYDVDKVMQRIDNEVPGLANLQIYKIDEIVKAGMKEN